MAAHSIRRIGSKSALVSLSPLLVLVLPVLARWRACSAALVLLARLVPVLLVLLAQALLVQQAQE